LWELYRPLKVAKKNTAVKYFEGHISDGCNTVRFVSFEPKLRPQLGRSIRQIQWHIFKKLCSR